MLKINLQKFLVLVIFVGTNLLSFSQTIIDYHAWTTASGCNIFSDPNNASTVINVPASINLISSTVSHLTSIGQPVYDNVNKTVNLESRIVSGSMNHGTEYRMTVNFKANASYKVTVTAIRIMAQQIGSNVLLRTDLNDGGSGGNNQCNGTGSIDATNGTSGLGKSLQIVKSSFSLDPNSAIDDYVFEYPSLASAQTYLMIAAIPPAGSVTQTILIRKIKIEETTPAPTFTIAPTPVSIACGSSTSKTFVVTNVYSSPGTLSYVWNLSSSSNGWIYNGNPAPQTFTTATNSIVLTSSPTASSVSNVSVTVKLNGANYTTLTSTVTLNTNFGSLSINVPATRCPSGSFSVNNIPSGGIVNWQANPVNIVSFPNPPTGNPINISKLGGNGTVNITAIVSVNQCSQPVPGVYLYYGQFSTTGSYTIGSSAPVTAMGTGANYVPPANIITFTVNNNGKLPGSSFTIQKVYGNAFVNVFGNTVTFSLGNYSSTNPANGVITLLTTVATSCGNTTQSFSFTTQGQCASCNSLVMQANPNPANDFMKIKLVNNDISLLSSKTNISNVQISDKMGKIVYSNIFKFATISSEIVIPVFNLKNDIYTIKIFNGVEWKSQKIIIQH